MRVYFIDIEHWDVPTQSSKHIDWDAFTLDADDFELNFSQDDLEHFVHPSYLNIMLF